MLTIRFKGEEDFYRSMVRVESNVERGSEAFVNELAELVINDINENWSAVRQARGSKTPPADDRDPRNTGNLASSINVDEQGRTLGGQFAAGDNVKMTFIRVDTSKGDDPQGRGNYAQALEDENYYNLPFLAPALARAKSHIEDIAKRTIKL